MTLVLILPAWLILLALVVGLCTAARVGDRIVVREPIGPSATGLPGTTEEYTLAPAPRTSSAGARGRVPTGNVAA